MLDLGLSDDMLAALLGHEIAHVTSEHFLKQKKRATWLNVASSLLSVGLIAASAADRDDGYVGPYGYTRDQGVDRRRRPGGTDRRHGAHRTAHAQLLARARGPGR